MELNDTRGYGPSKIGATLFQPFGITGETHPQSVISGRETYMDDRGGRGYENVSMRGGGVRSDSTLPLQKEIVFNDLRPESMYGADYAGGYENAGGYQRESDGTYQGEIRLGTMREPLRSTSSEHVHETRFL